MRAGVCTTVEMCQLDHLAAFGRPVSIGPFGGAGPWCGVGNSLLNNLNQVVSGVLDLVRCLKAPRPPIWVHIRGYKFTEFLRVHSLPVAAFGGLRWGCRYIQKEADWQVVRICINIRGHLAGHEADH
jgi:hypothetical protein